MVIAKQNQVNLIEISWNSCSKNYNFQHSNFVQKSLAELLFEYCENCPTMSSIPQGAFAAYKLRAKSTKVAVARIQTSEDKQPSYYSKKLMEYAPVKYNSKLMDSIWGLYNRYSPHNIKKNNDAELYVLFDEQQSMMIAAYAITRNLDMAKLDHLWKFTPNGQNKK